MDRNEDINEQLRLQQQIAAIEELGKRFMSREAISRYGNLKTAYPELAISVMAMIAEAVKSGQVNAKIDDIMFKDMLKRIKESRGMPGARR